MLKKMVHVQLYLAEELKTFRKEQKLSQEKMAEYLNIVPRSYSDLESGKYLLSTITFIFFYVAIIG
ncbi:MAG: helix-turn-helix transcriptional regulator [Eubacteriales bacterium]|nr:helix-turn-helix transcriptional regulator [Eubacteriales bacterium]